MISVTAPYLRAEASSSARRGSSRLALAVTGATALALALRLAFRVGEAGEIDSVRFLLALERFDVAAHRPHFPGYPVFVFLGRLLLPLAGDPVVALGFVCALSGALLVIPVALLVRATLGDRAARFAAVAVAVNPMLWLYSEKLLSDATGLLFLFSGLALVIHGLGRTEATPGIRGDGERRPDLLAAGFAVLGLTLGVRLSYFPFLLSAALLAWSRTRRLLPLALATCAGLAAWAIPFVAVTGWDRLVAIGAIQGTGHFNQWGGSIMTVPDLGARALALVWQVLANGLVTWWPDRPAAHLLPTAGLAVAVALALTARARPTRGAVFLWATLLVPYLAWAFLGQNVTLKVRHALPVVVLAIALAAFAVDRALSAAGEARRALAAGSAALWIGGAAISGLALAREHAGVAAPPVLLSRELEQRCATAEGRPVLVYTSTVHWHLPMYAPCVVPIETRRLSDARRDLAQRDPEAVAFVVSDVANVNRLRQAPLARFEASRYLHSAARDLALYRLGGSDDE